MKPLNDLEKIWGHHLFHLGLILLDGFLKDLLLREQRNFIFNLHKALFRHHIAGIRTTQARRPTIQETLSTCNHPFRKRLRIATSKLSNRTPLPIFIEVPQSWSMWNLTSAPLEAMIHHLWSACQTSRFHQRLPCVWTFQTIGAHINSAIELIFIGIFNQRFTPGSRQPRILSKMCSTSASLVLYSIMHKGQEVFTIMSLTLKDLLIAFRGHLFAIVLQGTPPSARPSQNQKIWLFFHDVLHGLNSLGLFSQVPSWQSHWLTTNPTTSNRCHSDGHSPSENF